MSKSKELLNMIEGKGTGKVDVTLDGKEYYLNREGVIKTLVQYHFDNPDMGDPEDFRSENQRMQRLKKDMKSFDLAHYKEQIELWYNEGEISLKDLKKHGALK